MSQCEPVGRYHLSGARATTGCADALELTTCLSLGERACRTYNTGPECGPDRTARCAAGHGTASWTSRPSKPSSTRSEEHTSELQSQSNLVCRLLLEKKKCEDTEHTDMSVKYPITYVAHESNCH